MSVLPETRRALKRIMSFADPQAREDYEELLENLDDSDSAEEALGGADVFNDAFILAIQAASSAPREERATLYQIAGILSMSIFIEPYVSDEQLDYALSRALGHKVDDLREIRDE